MAKSKSPITGRWRIISMSAWEDDFLDEAVEAYIEFDDKGWGDFHFGNVQGQMDCRQTTRDGAPAVEWSWDGNAEMDAAQGRGWAVLSVTRIARAKKGGTYGKTRKQAIKTASYQ